MDTQETEHVKISTEIPGPKSKSALEHFKQHTSPVVYHILPELVPKHAKGAYIQDYDGNVFLDFLSGVGVNAVGHGHPKVLQAVREQIENGMHFNVHVGPLPIYAQFLERVKETMGSVRTSNLANGKGFLGNSGTEAVEAAMKLARYYTNKPTIIAMDPSFHGRTAGSLAATTGAKGRKRMGAILNGVIHAKYPYAYRAPEGVDVTDWAIGSIEEILQNRSPPENTAAVIIETIAGEPGVIIPPLDYYPKLSKLCKDNGILLICDEVQMGLGKTGNWWAFSHFNVSPDIVTFAKPAGGGLPLGGILASREIADEWSPGHHASTFGGNPVAAAAGIATMDVIKDEGLLQRAKENGDYMLRRLKEINHDKIGDVRGKGMVFGIELVLDAQKKTPAAKEAGEIKLAAFKKGLITSSTGPYGNVIRLSPALNIERSSIDEGIEILERTIKEVLR